MNLCSIVIYCHQFDQNAFETWKGGDSSPEGFPFVLLLQFLSVVFWLWRHDEGKVHVDRGNVIQPLWQERFHEIYGPWLMETERGTAV